jgi:hypothetical protein
MGLQISGKIAEICLHTNRFLLFFMIEDVKERPCVDLIRRLRRHLPQRGRLIKAPKTDNRTNGCAKQAFPAGEGGVVGDG